MKTINVTEETKKLFSQVRAYLIVAKKIRLDATEDETEKYVLEQILSSLEVVKDD
jgi:hypothetical protein